MKRTSKTIDWANVVCRQCGRTFTYSAGFHPWAGGLFPAGTTVAVCSPECATNYTEASK